MTTTAQDTTPADTGQGAPAADPAPATEPTVAPVATEPTATPEPAVEGVQPEPTTPQPSDEGGQGLIAEYLEGVDEAHRDIVSDVLERYRKDSDANITRRFEELNAYKEFAESPDALQAPVFLYERLMESPLETLEWVLDRFQAEANIDLRSQLLERLNGQPGEQAPEGEVPADDPNRPLTVAEWQKLQEEQAAQAAEQQAQEQRREQAKSWLDDAAKQHGLELDGKTDLAVRQAIITQAAQLVPQFAHLGAEAGKAAIETAVEAFVNHFGKGKTPSPSPSPEPVVADGGTPPAPAEVTDLTDEKQRKAFMLSRLQGSSQE